jgi:hypothetical protein
MTSHKSPLPTGVRHLLVSLLALLFVVPLTAQDAKKETSTSDTERAAAKKQAELNAAIAAEPAKPADETVVLSPFVVQSGTDQGYFAANTLAGSRMKTNLADLGAAISIVTKQQMEDFASVDLNDAFRYEVNTEGSGTYTPATQAFRTDGLLDVNAGGTQGNSVSSFTNAIANRVRGIGIPSAATNYYPSIAALPPDSYNVQSFEISRGPNSMLFGLGSPAGIANVTTAQASVDRDSNQVQVRTDDRGSFRSSFSFNRALVKGKVAIYGAFLYNDQEFVRKPSYDITQRQYAAITYKPFAKTTIRANFENYDNKNRRPNTISPVDYITQWDLAGRPIYDNLTKKITITKTGQVVGPYISSASSPYAQQVRDYIRSLPNYNPALRGTSATAFGGTDTTFSFYNGQAIYGLTGTLNPTLSLAVPNYSASALFVPGMSQINTGRAVMTIANGQLQNWWQPLYNTTYGNTAYTTGYVVPGTTVTNVNNPISLIWNNAASSDVYDRNAFASGGWTNNSFISNMGGSYRYPGITNKSLYDWEKINILQADYGSQRNKNYNFEVEQQITRDLFANAGWFRQVFKQSSNYTIGQLNATAVRIDENKYLPDGTPNPYVGLPFVQDLDPDRYVNNQLDDHYRGMLAYTPDFTQSNGLLKWLGHHQILGLWSRDESMAVAIRQRLNYIAAGSQSAAVRYVANPRDNANGTRTGWNFGGATQRFYYLANPGDPAGKISSASGEWNPTTFTGNIRVYNYGTNGFEDANVTETYNTFADPARSERILQSLSTGITSYLWKDRLTLTFGARLDQFRARNSSTGAITIDGVTTPALTPQQKFLPSGYFNMESMWDRFGPWSRITGRTKTGGGVLRPFRNWASIDNRADNGGQFWQFVRDFGLVYNWSNNFDAPTGAQVDAFGKGLPNPQGVGRDMGFQFTALDNKLFARVTWFRSNSLNQRLSAGTALGRLTSQGTANATTGDVDGASVDAIFKNWARTIAKINMGLDPRIESPGALSTQQKLDIETAAEKIWKLPYNYYESLPGTITATGDAVATGMEAQVNYNTGNWRNRLTFGKQTTRNSNVLSQYDAWYAVRSPVWAAAKASDYLLPQYQSLVTYRIGDQTTGTQVDLTNFLTSYGYSSTVRITNPIGGQNPLDWANLNLFPQVQLAKDLDGQEAPGQRKYRWAYNTGYDFTTGRLKGFGVGGAERWEAKSIIGYYGKASRSTTANPNLLDLSDTTRPIYDRANFYTDLFVNYKTKVWNGKVGMTVQLNVENILENGGLQVVAVNYDGSPYGYRIVDSRKFTLTTTFDF